MYSSICRASESSRSLGSVVVGAWGAPGGAPRGPPSVRRPRWRIRRPGRRRPRAARSVGTRTRRTPRRAATGMRSRGSGRCRRRTRNASIATSRAPGIRAMRRRPARSVPAGFFDEFGPHFDGTRGEAGPRRGPRWFWSPELRRSGRVDCVSVRGGSSGRINRCSSHPVTYRAAVTGERQNRTHHPGGSLNCT